MMKKLLAFAIIPLFVGMSVPLTDTIVKKSTPIFFDGNTLYVGGDGPGNYSRIQAAINAAGNGNTIFVYDDSSPYYENVIINKSINLIGEDMNNTIIDGNYSGNVVDISVDWVNISGFTIQNSGYRYYDAGIEIDSCHNTVFSNIIINNSYGISFWGYGGSSNTISCNTITNNNEGIFLESQYNNIINNIITNNINGFGIGLYGESNIISINTITNNHIGIGLYCLSNTISGNNISNNDYGIDLVEDSNTIIGNSITYNSDGINLLWSRYNNIINNAISNNGDGIHLEFFSNSNTISGNNISNNDNGIYLYDSSGNNITDNKISNNYNGIRLLSSNNNTIIDNNIISNNGDGIYLSYYNSNNTIYHNNFIENTDNAYDIGNNIWDDGYPSGGNFWDDYHGTDSDGDGIGDTPYPIPDGDNKDRYPLGNFPPGAPIIDGPLHGKVRVEYEYNFSLSDPENDLIYLRVDWGNGTLSPWQGPYDSNTTVKLNHTWNQKGTYTIRAQAKDIYGAESEWGALEITMPKNQQNNQQFLNQLFFQIIQRLLNTR